MKHKESVLAKPSDEGLAKTSAPKVPPKGKPKVLVVELDYFALTSRFDPYILFWDANQAAKGDLVPKSVSYLWISRYTLEHVRSRILSEVAERKDPKVVVWSCSVLELQERLLPFWWHDYNQTILPPVAEDETAARDTGATSSLFRGETEALDPKSAVLLAVASSGPSFNGDEDPEPEDRTGEDEEVVLAPRRFGRAGRPKKSVGADDRRKPDRKDLRKAFERFRNRQFSGLGDVKKLTEKLSMIDRGVFLFHYRIDGNRVHQTSLVRTAEEFGIPEANIQKIIERSWQRLSELGFPHNEEWLLNARD